VPPNQCHVDFGGKFLAEAERLTAQVRSTEFAQKVCDIKGRCNSFLLELLGQVEKRIPSDQTVFSSLSALHSDKVLPQTARLPFRNLFFQHLISDYNNTEE